MAELTSNTVLLNELFRKISPDMLTSFIDNLKELKEDPDSRLKVELGLRITVESGKSKRSKTAKFMSII